MTSKKSVCVSVYYSEINDFFLIINAQKVWKLVKQYINHVTFHILKKERGVNFRYPCNQRLSNFMQIHDVCVCTCAELGVCVRGDSVHTISPLMSVLKRSESHSSIRTGFRPSLNSTPSLNSSNVCTRPYKPLRISSTRVKL